MLKKFSEKYINNYKELDILKFGFEFEFYSKGLNFYKMLEILNQYFFPIKIHGFRTYHSDFVPTEGNWKMERDLSGGGNMIEIVTCVMDFQLAKYYLLKVLKFIQIYGYTTEKCSLHINISFNDNTTNKLTSLNILKHILKTDEDSIYKIFPSRKNNIYAKTIKKLIPFETYDFSNISIDTIQHNVHTPNDKYYGINFININADDESRRLEYRYIGGKDYEFMTSDILDLMQQFGMDIINNCNADFDNDDIDNLAKFLDDKITNFKNFNTYNNFLIEFPNIHIQINKNDHYDIVSSYYPKLYKTIYKFVESTEDLDTNEFVINYFIESNRVEIIGAKFKSVLNINNYDFISCDITNGIFDKCNLINCDINNAEIIRTKIQGSVVDNCKLINVNVETSDLHDVNFINGFLNSPMVGGFFRSGEIGPYGSLSPSTKVINMKTDFFGKIEKTNDKKMKFKK